MGRTFKDIRYASLSARNVLDLALPDNVDCPPLVVFIHGGAFFMGDKSDSARERDALVAADFAVASANYRYSSEAIWPAQLEDLKAAFAFLREHAVDYGFDVDRLASFGPSAGGHLSACIGIASADDPATRLAACIIWFPPVDFPTMDEDIIATGVDRATGRNDGPESPESRLLGTHVEKNPEIARRAGPITLLSALQPAARLPDMLIMHGAKDPYIAAAQSQRLHEAIEASGRASRLALDILPEGTHGGGSFEDPKTMAKVVDFLRTSFVSPTGVKSESKNAS